MMFAAFIAERDPLTLSDLPGGLLTWVQVAGGFAAFALPLWLAFGLPRWRKEDRDAVPPWQRTLFVTTAILTYVFYVAAGIALMFTFSDMLAAEPGQARPHIVVSVLLALAGACALLAVGMPFILNLFQMRFRRIFALAKLSFKEALRRRVLYAFSGLLLVFLFASWFVPAKPSDEVRTYVSVVFWAMSALLLATAALLSAFSIPADIKQQTIHTIVTKPVERFEIILGRFLGFLALMTLVLVVMTAISLLYVVREVHPEAAAESLKARVPLYGELRFENTDSERTGINVGREWDYRGYITKVAANLPPQTARWDIPSVPSALGSRNQVRCEFSFDIYRTTKGDEGRGVNCVFRFTTWRYEPGNDQKFRKGRDAGEDVNKLSEELGYFEPPAAIAVTDYTTQSLQVPGGLFKNALASDAERDKELRRKGDRPPALQVRITCESPTQYVGMAKPDFFVRVDEPGGGEQWLFALNFFKAAFGLWLRLALIIGLAVVLSTYLTGVISLLVALVLYMGGVSRDFIQDVALGKNVGGGPLEAMIRMSRRELTGPSMTESTSTGDQIVTASDTVFRFGIGRLLNMVPDVNRFDLTNYVAEGFNISFTQMGMDFLLLFGYLLPWAVLAFYLIRWREVASSN